MRIVNVPPEPRGAAAHPQPTIRTPCPNSSSPTLPSRIPPGPSRWKCCAACRCRLAAGENLAVTGPSGCGKSTLLHIIGTLDTPTTGSVTLDGDDPFRLDEPRLAAFRNHKIGFIFQDHHLLPQCSVLENVLLPTLADGRAPRRLPSSAPACCWTAWDCPAGSIICRPSFPAANGSEPPSPGR